MASALVVKIAVEDLAAERLQTALNVVGAAVAAGIATSLWLAGESVRLALRDGPQDETFEAAREGARVRVCARCAARRGITAEMLRPGIQVAGAAAFVAEVTTPGTQALVY